MMKLIWNTAVVIIAITAWLYGAWLLFPLVASPGLGTLQAAATGGTGAAIIPGWVILVGIVVVLILAEVAWGQVTGKAGYKKGTN
jgi:hypothetical protein